MQRRSLRAKSMSEIMKFFIKQCTGGEEVEAVNVLVRPGYAVVTNHPQITATYSFSFLYCTYWGNCSTESLNQSNGGSIILKL